MLFSSPKGLKTMMFYIVSIIANHWCKGNMLAAKPAWQFQDHGKMPLAPHVAMSF